MAKNLLAMQETQVLSLGWEDTPEKGMAIYSSILAWRIPLTEEPGRLQSLGHKEWDTTEQLTLLLLHPYEDLFIMFTAALFIAAKNWKHLKGYQKVNE